MQKSSGTLQDRSSRLFTFLSKLAQMRSKPRRKLGEDREEQVFWFSEVPRDSDCFCVAWDQGINAEEQDVWLELKKPHVPAPPAPPELLRPWIKLEQLDDASRDAPELLREIAVAPSAGSVSLSLKQRLTDHPEVLEAYDVYLEQNWRPWATLNRLKATVQSLYNKLYSIYQKQQRLGETFEVVVGLGYLTWQAPAGYEVARHLVTVPVSLDFQSVSGKIAVKVSLETARPRLEQDMFDISDQPNRGQLERVEEHLDAAEANVWDGVSVLSALKAWVNSVDGGAAIDATLERQTGLGKTLRVHLAPALILRKRGERTLVQMFESIATQLEAMPEVPLGTARLVSTLDDVQDGARSLENSEIYFPRPANDEQRQIVEKLRERQGVLVQGPPGTGKSHTIVNLMTHLLATGQRVLVTSHTARALESLRDKLPEEIQALCVMHLGEDKRAKDDLEKSISGITQRHAAWNSKQSDGRIKDFAQQLDMARRREAEIRGQLRALREADVYEYPARAGAYAGTAQSMAQQLEKRASNFLWLKPFLEFSLEPNPPHNRETMAHLLAFLQSEDNQAEIAQWGLVDPSSLPKPDGLEKLFDAEKRALEAVAQRGELQQHPAYSVLKTLTPATLETWIGTVSGLSSDHAERTARMDPWKARVLEDVKAGRVGIWTDLQRSSEKRLTFLQAEAVWVSEASPTGLETRAPDNVWADAGRLRAYLQSGKKLGGFMAGLQMPKEIKDVLYLKTVSIGGAFCDGIEVLNNLIRYLEAQRSLSQLENEWKALSIEVSGTFGQRVTRYHELEKDLSRILGLEQTFSGYKGALESVGLPQSDIASGETLIQVGQAVQALEPLARVQDALNRTQATLAQVWQQPGAHPVVGQLLEAFKARNVPQYVEMLKHLSELGARKARHNQEQAWLEQLAKTLPRLAEALRSSFSNPAWPELLATWEEAWAWWTTWAWLGTRTDPSQQPRLNADLERTREEIRDVLRQLAAEKAWNFCMSGMGETERQKLLEWKQATNKIGKGTGKHAPKHRRVARQALEGASRAIPAWIMPIYRVAESFAPQQKLFDVAIIDEASQSGPEALFLCFIAHKVVVVGDDKQIKPDAVGLDRDMVEELRKRYLDDLPLTHSIGDVDGSFFETAEILFGGRIRLREHFRCMPEIIQFSNNLCYADNPMIPLKQFGIGRLEPAVSAHHVKSGYQEGSSGYVLNRPEAEAIVDKVLELHQNPQYVGKTFGVISLLGDAQAQYIATLLGQRMDARALEQRKLVCGDAYAFQGDERDVILLSMVRASEAGKRIPKQADARTERRYNVSASRAREQMFLFHSTTLNDLNPECLRYRLLEYCQNPHVEQAPLEGLSVEEWAHKLEEPHRPDRPPRPFDSWFEVQVFIEIARRGFRVIPQYEVGGYRIDLVVEGMTGKMAVECDGDRWHGPEQFDKDLSRQLELERAGFQFWRVRGSTFYRDPQGALDDLWKTLARAGVSPSVHSAWPYDLAT